MNESDWVAVSFVAFVAVICFFGGGKAFAAYLDNRCQRALKILDEALAMRKNAEKLLQEAKQRMVDADTHAQILMKSAHQEIDQYKQNVDANLRQARERHLRHMEEMVKIASDEAINDIRQQIAAQVLKKVDAHFAEKASENIEKAHDNALKHVEKAVIARDFKQEKFEEFVHV